MMALTDKQRAFVEAYLQCGFNATEAARRAGYSEKRLWETGCELKKHPEIAAQIDERLKAEAMTANETLRHLGDLARGRYAECFEVYGNGMLIRWDLEKAQRLGLLNTVKKIKPVMGGYDVEFWDRIGPLNTLAKHHKLVADKAPTIPDVIEVRIADEAPPDDDDDDPTGAAPSVAAGDPGPEDPL